MIFLTLDSTGKIVVSAVFLAFREFDFKFKELKWMADKMFDLLHKNIHISQAYEIQQNYGKDLDFIDEYELKLIDEESYEDIDEQYIINAKNKFIACINE